MAGGTVVCKDCGKPFAPRGKNVVVCRACVDVRLGKQAKSAPARAARKTPKPAPGEIESLRARLAQAQTDLMDANAEATRLWTEKQQLAEQLRKATFRLKLLEADREVAP